MIDEEHPLHSEIQKRIQIAENKRLIRQGVLGRENFSRKDLAIDALGKAYCPRDHVTDEIKKELDRTEISAAFHQNSKQQQTDNLIHKILSGKMLFDHKLRKAFGFPKESFTIRPRNSLYMKRLIDLINPGGLVTIAEGSYNIEDTLSVGTRIGIMGYGDATELNLTADIDYVFQTKSGQINWRNVFEHFFVNGNRGSRTKGTAIHLRNCQHAEVRSVSMQDMKTHCVYMSGESVGLQTLGCHLLFNYMRDCEGDYVTNGAEVYDLLAEHNIMGGFCGDPPPTGDGVIGIGFVLSWDTHAIIHHNHLWRLKRGVQAFFAHQSKITSNIIDSPHEIGICVQNSQNVTVHDNTVKEHNWNCEDYDAGILVFGSEYGDPLTQYYSDDVTLTGNRVYSSYEYGKFGIKVGDYARRAFINGNNCYGNQDDLWDIWITGTGTIGVLFGINMGRCPNNDYFHLNYLNIHLITSFLIGSGGVSAYDLVSISGNNEVVKATLANSAKGIGVAVETGNQGITAKILGYGRIPVTADGTINAGDLITASDSTPGRAITVPTTFYNVTTSEAPAHSHSCSEEGSHVHVVDAVANHTHGGATGAGGSHYHTTDSAGAHAHGTVTGADGGHSHIVGVALSINAVGDHSHSVGMTWGDTGAGGDPQHTHGYYRPSSPTGQGGGHGHTGTGSGSTDTESDHTHSISSDGSHWHTTGDSVPSTHSHVIYGDGSHTHTMQYNANHAHTIGNGGAHTHTVEIPLGKVFGKAATGATAGNQFDLLLGVVR